MLPPTYSRSRSAVKAPVARKRPRSTLRRGLADIAGRWQRIIVAIAVPLVVGAFLLWGPIGLGNGPLAVPPMAASFGSVQGTSQPTAYVATLVNAGGSAAVIDGVTVTSANGYQPARILSVRVARASMYGCIDNGPASNLASCVRPPLVAAAGFAVGPHANTVPGSRGGAALVIEMARRQPRSASSSPRSCCVITSGSGTTRPPCRRARRGRAASTPASRRAERELRLSSPKAGPTGTAPAPKWRCDPASSSPAP